MITWSSEFETKLPLVDRQHKRLFEMLNALADGITRQGPQEESLHRALDELTDYANQHFIDEEMLMAQYHVDPRHITLHRMEHKSFIFDVQRMRGGLHSQEDLLERAEALVRFVTSWLVYHTLRTDQIMAAQIKAIGRGMPPTRAWETEREARHNPATTQMVLDAVLHLWRDAVARCWELEGIEHPPTGLDDTR